MNHSLNILHVLHQYWPAIHGSGIYFQKMSERLARNGHRVTIFTSNAYDFDYFNSRRYRKLLYRKEIHNGVQIIRHRVWHLPQHGHTKLAINRMAPCFSIKCLTYGAAFLPTLHLAALLPQKYDIVHGGVLPYGGTLYPASVIAKRNHLPLIMTPFLHTAEPSHNLIAEYNHKRYLINCIAQADTIIAQTQLEKAMLTKLGIDQHKIEILGMGIDTEDIQGGCPERVKNEYHIKDPIVLHVGSKWYEKGTIHLVEAMKLLWTNGFRATLVIAGRTLDDFRAYFSSQSPSIRNKCLLFESIQGQIKKDLFAAADVFAMPSRTDSYGIVYLEAWACGKPVIGAIAGGVPEVISDGIDGFLIPFGNIYMLAHYIKLLIRDQTLAIRMGHSGFEKVTTRYTWDLRYKKLYSIYESLIRDSNSRTSRKFVVP